MSRNNFTSSSATIETPTPTTHAFQIIGVTPPTTPEKIKKAYKAKVLLSHPDKTGTHDTAAQFREVQEAYEVLEAANFPIVCHTWLQAQKAAEAQAKMEAERKRWKTDFHGAMGDYSVQVQECAFFNAWRMWAWTISVVLCSLLFWLFADHCGGTNHFKKFASGIPCITGILIGLTFVYGAFVQLYLYAIWAQWAKWRLVSFLKATVTVAYGSLRRDVIDCIDACGARLGSVALAVTALVLGQICLCLALRALY